MNSEQIITVNDYRHRNNQYTDTISATKILSRTNKHLITPQESPFNKLPKYRASAEVYKTYERMVFQLEEWSDIPIALHTKFDIVLLFNYSWGHDTGIYDGLNVNQMGSIYRGLSHPEMHPKNIKQEAGYIGPHTRIIEPGQVQHMVFQDNDGGPFWVMTEER